jgi:hypothetical protein
MTLARTSVAPVTSSGSVEIFSDPPLQALPCPKRINRNRHRMQKKTDKPPNPYFLFCAKRRTELQAENPLMPSREVTRLLAAEWRILAETQKEEFSSQYQGLVTQKEKAQKESRGTQPKQFLIQIPLVNGQFLVVPAYFA